MPHQRLKRMRRTGLGGPPGDLSVAQTTRQAAIHVTRYTARDLQVVETTDATNLHDVCLAKDIAWVEITGACSREQIETLGRDFGLHPLALEDIVKGNQRPKVEEYDQGLFIVIPSPQNNEDDNLGQTALFLGKSFLLTFAQDNAFTQPIHDRLQRNRGRIRKLGADYLAYAVIDCAIDHLFPILEAHNNELIDLEDRLLRDTVAKVVSPIHATRHSLLALRKVLWPLRDALSALMRKDTPFVTAETRVYLRDCEDHVAQLLDLLAAGQDQAANLLDLHLSSVNTRMNEVMKVLTIIATIFIPLSFVTSLYGMNFDPNLSPFNMPELRWRFGYLAVLALMGGIAVGFLLFLYRKGWLGERREHRKH